ncbi:MAG: ARMT1-like domain-containing protein [Candidatus Omnitrophica bacterium]|nr:ARMT1-like domain-containing protein [Candidatus Omnitrophota bacterium]
MKTYLECIPCFFKQALEAARLSGVSGKTQKKVLDEVALCIPGFPFTSSPPEMARIIYGVIKKTTGNGDPYLKIKEESNKLALSVYPRLKKKVEHSRDSLLTAVELAIAGNIIDYGVKNTLNVEEELKRILDKEDKVIRKENKSIFNYKSFRSALKRSNTILYLADNAGEVVFDRILIEEIKETHRDKKIIYAVKEKPVINDALREDAVSAGIGEKTTIISSGVDTPGTVLSLCSKKFLKIFKRADMVISKGQGNFEALSDCKRPVFFLFMAKCPVIAKDVKCGLGDVILLYKNKRIKKEYRSRLNGSPGE